MVGSFLALVFGVTIAILIGAAGQALIQKFKKDNEL